MQPATLSPEAFATRVQRLRWSLLIAWASFTFCISFFARDLNFAIFDTPVNFWLSAQGSVLVFLIIVWAYALLVNRWEKQTAANSSSQAEN